ncbi:hypothetical protein BSKO_07503 [Bryopsis sp. KO-2023]|nr:hypothetical protein BSKO_07503 [Bryopsis sp. KO-2023]
MHAILEPTNSVVVDEKKLRIEMNNGQTWLLYASSPISIAFGGPGDAGESTAAFSGIIRVALARNGEFEELLDTNRYTIPVAGKVHLSHKQDIATIRYEYETATYGGSTGDLLLMALPHHIDAGLLGINGSEKHFRTIKGHMTGVLGKTWVMIDQLPPISWISRSAISPDKISAVRSALLGDQYLVPSAQDPYFFGKEIAAMGRLALIADDIGERRTAQNIIERMKEHLEPWLMASNPDALVYNRTWGGLVSTFGMQNAAADFGNGVYNDHHYHYGYLTYAAAVIGRTDADWLENHSREVLDLVRDFANPNTEDPYFPFSRHKDMYAWHSWAGGLFSAADAKNQESTSEAVNAYYAVYLLGVALRNEELAGYGRIMMQMEIRAAQKYWQVVDTEIYAQPYADRTVVGVLWSTKVDHATWFGGNLEYIHGIQFLPITSISEALLRPEWISKSYPILSTTISRSEPPMSDEWLGYIYIAHAIIDPELAWEEVQKLKTFLGGNTKTNTLYWVATRSAETASQPGPPKAISVDLRREELMVLGQPPKAPTPSNAPPVPPFHLVSLVLCSLVMTLGGWL